MSTMPPGANRVGESDPGCGRLDPARTRLQEGTRVSIDPTLLDDLEWRGLVAHSTDLDALREALAEGSVRFYVGFDPTAPSLHMGNLVQILTARRLQDAGHTPYVLVGGATGMIGDPKDSGERTLNSLDTVKDWVERVRRQIEPFLSFEGDNAATMVNNYDWTANLSTIDFLRDIGKHFPVNRMLARDVVRVAARGGHQLHRVQLRAAAVDGLPQPLPRPRRDAAVRRLRPVGQPHRRRRADPARRRRPGARVRDAAGDQGRRHQVRQDRGRRAVARPRDDVAVRLLPVLAQRRGREGRRAAPDLHVPRRATRSRSSRRRHAEKPFLRAGAEGAGRRRSRRCARRRGDRAGARPPSAALFGGGDLRALERVDPRRRAARGRRARGRPRRRAARRSSTCWSTAGLAKSKGEARRTVGEGGAYLNNERVEDPELRAHRRTTCSAGSWLVLRRGKKNFAGVEVR